MLTEKWAATQSCSPGTASLGAVPPAFPEGDSVRSGQSTSPTYFFDPCHPTNVNSIPRSAKEADQGQALTFTRSTPSATA